MTAVVSGENPEQTSSIACQRFERHSPGPYDKAYFFGLPGPCDEAYVFGLPVCRLTQAVCTPYTVDAVSSSARAQQYHTMAALMRRSETQRTGFMRWRPPWSSVAAARGTAGPSAALWRGASRVRVWVSGQCGCKRLRLELRKCTWLTHSLRELGLGMKCLGGGTDGKPDGGLNGRKLFASAINCHATSGLSWRFYT